MKIAIACNDTRGGIQPYVALALGLARAGHAVRAIAPADLAPLFSAAGIAVHPLAGSMHDAVGALAGAVEGGTLASVRAGMRELSRHLNGWTRSTLEACEGADLVTGGVGGMVIGLGVAEKLGVPFIETHLQPLGAAADTYPGMLLPRIPRWLGRWGMRASHALSDFVAWMPFSRTLQRARVEVLGLEGRTRPDRRQAVLYGFSRHVVPVPESRARRRLVTGYWFMPDHTALQPAWRPPAGLQEFLAGDSPVVSIGFGSMPSTNPAALAAMLAKAARIAGVRAVLLSGWAGFRGTDLGEGVYCADSLPHDWLFPRMGATVHHGGAGTTGAALRAGVPTIVIPFTMDQPFWAARAAALGVAPPPIPRRRLDAHNLAEALRLALRDAGMRQRAAELGRRIGAENGVEAAVEFFDRHAAGPYNVP